MHQEPSGGQGPYVCEDKTFEVGIPDYQMTTVTENVRDKRVVNVPITGCISDLGVKKIRVSRPQKNTTLVSCH